MKKVGSTQRRGTEKAIIDALLKISEIVQKTEASRQHQKLTNSNKHSKKTAGDGDYNELHDDALPSQQVPVPPPMRTLDSYVSGFNQQTLQQPSNCNRGSIYRPRKNVLNHPWDSEEHHKRYEQSSSKQRRDSSDYKDRKRHHSESSATSTEDHHRKKSSKHHLSYKSFRSSIKQQPTYQASAKTDNQPTFSTFNSQATSYQINSAATTILDDQSSSLIMIPIASVPTVSPPIVVEQQPSINPTSLHIDQQQFLSPPNILTSSKTDFDIFIDQQLQATLEKRLRSHSLPSTITNHEEIQRQQQLRKARLATLTKSETGKLINELDFAKPVCDLEHYEKQRELAMLAAKQGNYSLSYSIYTNLLHDSQYDCKLKSEILASRATTLLLEEKCFESIDDCTQAIAFNQWNKLAYVVRAACWMIKQEYSKAVEDYSKLFHFFDQSQHVLDLLNLAYEKLKSSNTEDDQSIKIEEEIQSIKNIQNENQTTQPMTCVNPTQSLSLPSPTVYLCYPYEAYPTWYSTNDEQSPATNGEVQQPTYMITNASFTSHPSLITDQSPVITRQISISSERPISNPHELKHSNNNAIPSSVSINEKSQSNLIWIKNPYRSF